MVSTSSSPRETLRLMMCSFFAPSSAHSTPMALAAPPAPRIATTLPASGMSASFRERTKPLPSVFSPISLPSRTATVFTAPMMRAASLSSSRYSSTATLWGMVRLMPFMSMARMPFIASSSFSTGTRQVR